MPSRRYETNILTRLASLPLSVDGRRILRQRSPDLPLIRCPALERLYRTLPRAVSRTRFLSPLCVFIFGMSGSSQSSCISAYRATDCTQPPVGCKCRMVRFRLRSSCLFRSPLTGVGPGRLKCLIAAGRIRRPRPTRRCRCDRAMSKSPRCKRPGLIVRPVR